MSGNFVKTTEAAKTNEASIHAPPAPSEAAPQQPVLEYSKAPGAKPAEASRQPTVAVKVSASGRKKGRKGVVALTVLIILAGGAASVFGPGVLGGVTSYGGFYMKDVTNIPDGAHPPEFIPVNPAEYRTAGNEELVTVPDENGLNMAQADVNGAETPLFTRNYYTQTPNASIFYTGSAQDESYVYFIPPQDKTSGLMRVKISDGKAELVSGANDFGREIYSFALFRQEIIACEYSKATDTYVFSSMPKSGGGSRALFEYDLPAHINVHDNKLFMLFAPSGRLGVFDPETDARPALIDLGEAGEGEEYLPPFSVVNGYLYYGISYGGGSSKYMRRSLYTGETVTVLDSGGTAIQNPCWDSEGGAYYTQFEHDSNTYSLMAKKDGNQATALSAAGFGGFDIPLVALQEEFLIAMTAPGVLSKHELEDFTTVLDADVQRPPYAVTRDFLIAPGGVYRIQDFSLISF